MSCTADVGTNGCDGSRAAEGGGGYTHINLNNAASSSATVDCVAWYKTQDWDGGDCDAASFTDEGSNVYSTNGVADSPLEVTSAAGCQTFTAPGDFTAFNISNGEYIGVFITNNLDQDTSGGSGLISPVVGSGDFIPCSSETFYAPNTYLPSLAATLTGAAGLSIPIAQHHFKQQRR